MLLLGALFFNWMRNICFGCYFEYMFSHQVNTIVGTTLRTLPVSAYQGRFSLVRESELEECCDQRRIAAKRRTKRLAPVFCPVTGEKGTGTGGGVRVVSPCGMEKGTAPLCLDLDSWQLEWTHGCKEQRQSQVHADPFHAVIRNIYIYCDIYIRYICRMYAQEPIYLR